MRHYQAHDLRSFETVCDVIRHDLLYSSREVAGATWQSQDVSQRPEMVTMEVLHASLELDISGSISELVKGISPNLPWADDHFAERVGGKPLNPPPSEAWWPYAQAGNAAHKEGEQFSHTYPERMWPKHAGHKSHWCEPHCLYGGFNRGVRYNYGDLGDVVNQLRRESTTRQAYLPIWFPEDTGAVQGQRVPCTLGYRFIYRDRLDITYDIRSCDFIRHFRDDVYMAARLCHWVAEQVDEANLIGGKPEMRPGRLIMNITSLHAFAGDRAGMLTLDAQSPIRASRRLIESLS
jgi:hypothetical protein